MKKFLLTILFLFPCVTFAYRIGVESYLLNTSLYGWWTFDGKDVVKGTLLDESGNGHTGSFANIATSTFYAPGKIGQGGNFDGVNDYVNFPSISSIPLTQFTLVAWINNFQLGASQGDVIRKLASAHGFELQLAKSGGFYGINCNLDGASQGLFTSATDLYKNGWHLVACVWDGATITPYIDLTKGTSGAATVYTDSASNLLIGANSGSIPTRGVLDDVRIYTRALSQSELAQLYNADGIVNKKVTNNKQTVNASSSLIDNGLIGWWTFDGKDSLWTSQSAGTERDASGNGNTGTFTNMNRFVSAVPGKIGQGMYFDGANDSMVFSGRSLGGTASGAATISFWYFATRSQTSGYFLFGGTGGGLRLAYTDNNRLNFTANAATSINSSTQAITVGKWNFITATTDSSGNGNLYVNGVSVGSGSVGTPSAPTGSNTRICGNDVGSQVCSGILDDFREYNRVLSATEVTQLYNAGF